MIFHMVWSNLFRVLALKILKWMFLIGWWRISTYEKVVSWPNTPNKMNHTMWKSMKNCVPKWCCKLCAFLFKVTCPFWKMCLVLLYVSGDFKEKFVFSKSHLSKIISDLKQKCTQLPTPFLGTVFHALSLGVIHFVRSVRSRNQFIIGWNCSTANQKLPI